MKITQLKIKDNELLGIDKLTILVGPNNSGKSQTLRDIRSRLVEGRNANTILVESINLEWPAFFKDESLAWLERFDSLLPRNVKRQRMTGTVPNDMLVGVPSEPGMAMNNQINLDYIGQVFTAQGEEILIESIGKWRVALLDGESRLRVAVTSASPDLHSSEPPQNLMQALLMDESGVEDKLRHAFRQTFGTDILLDDSGRAQTSFRIAPDFSRVSELDRHNPAIMGVFPKLDAAGDGYKSFVGVVLSLYMYEDRIVLLDEPEAFLHPAQARILGRWLADHARQIEGQIIVSTHNAYFLEGVLSGNRNVDIYRLSRAADRTSYSHITPAATSDLAREPALSSQRVLEAIFHKGVVVSESDSDRSVYQTVASSVFGNQNLLFIQSFGKQAIAKIVRLLKACTIPVCAIADIDILNPKDNRDFETLLRALNGTRDITSLLQEQKTLAAHIEGQGTDEAINDLKERLTVLVEELNQGANTWPAIREVASAARDNSLKWRLLKRSGVEAAILNGATRSTAAMIIEDVKVYSLFIVPKGELESWLALPVSRDDKNRWAITALDAIQRGECSEDLKTFIGEILVSMGQNVAHSQGALPRRIYKRRYREQPILRRYRSRSAT